MRYGDLTIGSIDQDYLDKLSDIHDVDYYDADIIITEDTDNADITNQLFNYVLTTAINNLDISDHNKEQLEEHIYCNCLDSGFDIGSENVDNLFTEATEEEKQIIKKFLDL